MDYRKVAVAILIALPILGALAWYEGRSREASFSGVTLATTSASDTLTTLRTNVNNNFTAIETILDNFSTTTANTWTATQTFDTSSTTNATTSVSAYFSYLANPAGTFTAIDPSGRLIATGSPATSPGGSNTYVQFNDSSALGGDAQFTWNKTTNTLTVGDVSNAGIISLAGTTGSIVDGAGDAGIDIDSSGSLDLTSDVTLTGTAPDIWLWATSSASYQFYNTAGTFASIFDFSAIASSNKTITVPNLTGTLALSGASQNVSFAQATTSSLYVTGLGTPAGTILAADPTGKVIATTTAASGISSLGPAGQQQTGSSQTFATSTSGTDFTITSSGNTHTFNIPDAGSSARGLVTTGTQTIAGAKTFSGNATFSGIATFSGSTPLRTYTVSTESNLAVFNTRAGEGISASDVSLDIGSPSLGMDGRVLFRGSSNANLNTSRSYASLLVGSMQVTEPGSGTQPLITQLAIKPLYIVDGAATVTNTATLFVEGAATSTTPTGRNYSILTDGGDVAFGTSSPAFLWSHSASKLSVTNSSSTNATTTNLHVLSLTSAVPVFDANGLAAEASTQTCTNQFVRALSAAYVATCATVSLTADVTGTLPVGNGGTGATTFTAGQLLYGAGSGAVQAVATSSATISSPLTGSIVCVGTGCSLGLGDVKQYPAFRYATTTWSGTTTIALGPAYVAETWNGVKCFTNAGTVNVVFNDGTNNMNLFNASTTVGTVTLSSNNSFTAGEKRYVTIGTPASSPTEISCTVSKTLSIN